MSHSVGTSDPIAIYGGVNFGSKNSARFELRREVRVEQRVTRYGSIHFGFWNMVPWGRNVLTFLSCQGNQIFLSCSI